MELRSKSVNLTITFRVFFTVKLKGKVRVIVKVCKVK